MSCPPTWRGSPAIPPRMNLPSLNLMIERHMEPKAHVCTWTIEAWRSRAQAASSNGRRRRVKAWVRRESDHSKHSWCEYRFISLIAKATWCIYNGGMVLKSGTHWPMESCSHVVLKQTVGVATDLCPQLNKYPVFRVYMLCLLGDVHKFFICCCSSMCFRNCVACFKD